MTDDPDSAAGDPFVGSATQFADIARALGAEPSVQTVLKRIVDFAAEHVAGCDGAGILLAHGGEIVTGAWSNDRVRRVEELEYELREGPCVDAIGREPVFESADLRDQLSVWPRFAPLALDAGIESMLGFRLFAAEDTLGALDLYGYRAGAFDESSRATATVLAAHAALALVGAQLHERDLETISGLNDALASRDEIGQAKGILMATRKITADTAFGLLIRESQAANQKLRAIAAEVVRTGELPGDREPDASQPSR